MTDKETLDTMNKLERLLVTPLNKTLRVYLAKYYPEVLAKMVCQRMLGRKLDLKHPKDLNEKINWLKFNSDTTEWTRLADKYQVRTYVKERGLEQILIPLYGKWDRAEDINFETLPEQFVLKTNNGAGTVLLVKDKKELDIPITRKKLNKWLKQTKIGYQTVELHYTRIKPCIIAEKLIVDASVKDFSQSLIDYKIWCFDGKPFCCLVVYDRNISSGEDSLDLYDLEWNPIRECLTHPETRNFKSVLKKPDHWEEMLNYASILSKGHKQVRVDLYNIDGKIYFGELTFTALGGYMIDYTPEILRIMGDQIHLDIPS